MCGSFDSCLCCFFVLGSDGEIKTFQKADVRQSRFYGQFWKSVIEVALVLWWNCSSFLGWKLVKLCNMLQLQRHEAGEHSSDLFAIILLLFWKMETSELLGNQITTSESPSYSNLTRKNSRYHFEKFKKPPLAWTSIDLKYLRCYLPTFLQNTLKTFIHIFQEFTQECVPTVLQGHLTMDGLFQKQVSLDVKSTSKGEFHFNIENKLNFFLQPSNASN